MDNKGLPVYLNTWVIVLAFLFCWPVGIVLIILRTNANKQNMFDGSSTTKVCTIAGVFLILIGLGTFSNSVFGGLFWAVGGAALIYYAQQNKKKVERYKTYIDLIANQRVTSLDTISNTLNISYDVVVNDIKTLISKGTFRGAKINEVSRCIELATRPQVAEENFGGFIDAMTGYANNAGMSTEAVVTAACPGCGGTVAAPKGSAVECEYCGKYFSV